jgi:hypothetical protein
MCRQFTGLGIEGTQEQVVQKLAQRYPTSMLAKFIRSEQLTGDHKRPFTVKIKTAEHASTFGVSLLIE